MLKFDEAGLELPLDFKQRLVHQLVLQGAGINVPADLLKILKYGLGNLKGIYDFSVQENER